MEAFSALSHEQWVERMNESLAVLAQECRIEHDRGLRSVRLTFRRGAAITTIGVGFNDEQSRADMVILYMTTQPDSEKGNGAGSDALRSLLRWARSSGLENIQAVQVQVPSEYFWTRNGFVSRRNSTNDFQYVHPPPG